MSDKTKLLFVDDSQEFLDLLKIKLGKEFEVFCCDNASDGLVVKKKEKIRIVVTDLEMPLINGIQFCKRIRDEDPVSIIIGCTAHKKLFGLYQCREAGFDEYTTKGNQMGDLKEILKESEKRVERWMSFSKK